MITRRTAVGTIAAGLTMPWATRARSQDSKELKLYNWFDYIPQALLDKFAAETGIVVTVDTYDSNENLLARLKSGVTGYDLAVPSDYMVEILVAENLLEQVDAASLPNFSNVIDDMKSVPWDPARAYSVPYQIGITSFMVDDNVFSGDIDTLDILFNPPPELKGRINMLRDMNDVINMALRYLGYPRCNNNPDQMREVSELLEASKANWLSFNSDGAKEALVSGDAAAGMIWNGFGLRAREERPSLRYAFPKQGYSGFADNIVVLKGAPNLDNARAFMDFMMSPENAAMLTNYARYISGIKDVDPFLDEVQKTSPEVNIPEGAPRPEFVPSCSADVVSLYDRVWTKVLG